MLSDEPQERLLDEVLGGGAVPRHGNREAVQVTVELVVEAHDPVRVPADDDLIELYGLTDCLPRIRRALSSCSNHAQRTQVSRDWPAIASAGQGISSSVTGLRRS